MGKMKAVSVLVFERWGFARPDPGEFFRNFYHQKHVYSVKRIFREVNDPSIDCSRGSGLSNCLQNLPMVILECETLVKEK